MNDKKCPRCGAPYDPVKAAEDLGIPPSIHPGDRVCPACYEHITTNANPYGKGDLVVLLDDLEAGIGAMDSWVDAFGEEEEHAETAIRVRRAMAFFEMVKNEYQTPVDRRPKLRLVGPGDPEEGK